MNPVENRKSFRNKLFPKRNATLTPLNPKILEGGGHYVPPLWFLQGGFFYWSALKMTKCQTLRKF